MIPKKIHYCWFGRGEMPDLAIKCINSWKDYLPDYELVLWNEDNFNVNTYQYTKQAYEAKKYAFVSDVVRLYALVNIGGVYMDTDVEVLNSLDSFLHHDAFSGFENEQMIPTGIMASKKGFKIFVDCLKEYETASFVKSDGKYDLTTNVQKITNKCKEVGFVGNNTFQVIQGFALYPKTYFCPLTYGNSRKTDFGKDTYTIHHFAGSWKSERDKMKERRRERRRAIKEQFKDVVKIWMLKLLGEK